MDDELIMQAAMNRIQGPVESFEDLKGRAFVRVEQDGDSALRLYLNEREFIHMYHEQDCCEQVWIDDICGDLDDLVGAPIVFAEESTNEGDNDWGSQTWTFYRFQTQKGSVDIRWCGESNGYYSERVTVEIVRPEELPNYYLN